MSEQLINNADEFYDFVKNGELYDNLTYNNKYHEKQFYEADTYGNDSYYQLYIFTDDKTVYWGEAVLTEDIIEREGENYFPQWDEYMYKYSNFPIDVNEFKNWLNKKIKDGINEGWKLITNYDPFENLPINSYIEWEGEKIWKFNIPDYALIFLINGDSSALDEDEIKMIKEWERKFKVKRIEPTNETNDFDINPAFGEPCATTLCKVYG